MKRAPIKFTIHHYADISTAYLEESDLKRLGDETMPGHVALVNGGYGAYWCVATDDEIWAEHLATWTKFRMSRKFVAIMTELRRQGIPYVRFDADGGDVAGTAGERHHDGSPEAAMFAKLVPSARNVEYHPGTPAKKPRKSRRTTPPK